MRRLIKNLFGDIFTAAVGSVAGVPEIIEGAGQLSEADKLPGILKLIQGVVIVLLGALSSTKPEQK